MIDRCYIEITNICNLNCDFCPKHHRALRKMTLQEFEHLTDELQGKVCFLYFHVMGEPLLHPLLPQFISLARAKGFKTVLTSNGTLLPRAMSLLGSLPHKVQLSLHSHESNRSGRLDEYINQVMDFAIEAARRGTCVVLRLWNQGGRDRENAEVQRLMAQRVAQPWTERSDGFRLCDNLYLEFDRKFQWPEVGESFAEGLTESSEKGGASGNLKPGISGKGNPRENSLDSFKKEDLLKGGALNQKSNKDLSENYSLSSEKNKEMLTDLSLSSDKKLGNSEDISLNEYSNNELLEDFSLSEDKSEEQQTADSSKQNSTKEMLGDISLKQFSNNEEPDDISLSSVKTEEMLKGGSLSSAKSEEMLTNISLKQNSPKEMLEDNSLKQNSNKEESKEVFLNKNKSKALQKIGEKPEQLFCKALLKQIGVLVDGSLVPCCLDHNGDAVMGNLFHQSLEEILSSPRARALVEGFRHHRASERLCQHCESALAKNSFRGKARS
jgi:radical SAM protein with 4Fe4S-binding SPASM domain